MIWILLWWTFCGSNCNKLYTEHYATFKSSESLVQAYDALQEKERASAEIYVGNMVSLEPIIVDKYKLKILEPKMEWLQPKINGIPCKQEANHER